MNNNMSTIEKKKDELVSIIKMNQAIEWIRMLSTKLNPTFILGIFIIYGLGQGFSGSLFRVVVDYYWKDVQLLQPSSLQFYLSLFFIPWILKPLWGILTDAFPIRGFHRRPYFIISGLIGTISAFVLAFSPHLRVAPALVCFVGVSASLAIADVTIDACIARSSIVVREVASDLQTLCGLCSSVGALVGFLLSGFFVHHLGPQVVERVGVTIRSMYQTIMYPQVWKPSLYMFLSLALNVSTHEGHFYWYTDSKAGPAFSQEFVGVIYAIGAVASIMGVIIYQKALKDYPFRKLLFYAQLLYALSGVVDLFFVLRWNLIIGIPDYFFVVIEETATRITGKLRWMPMMVLSTQLCPLGIEGTFFALLMCIDSIGALLSKMGGGVLLRILHITRTDFGNLWLAVLVRGMLRFATLALIFLVPKAGQHEGLLPSQHLEENLSDDNTDEETLELVPIKGGT
ncbi:PREDICTED: probable folate-biopterin transporter 6 isoform X2 [Lupinus angustifolius]|uniref:probable folate-biopterin transporter 6 isoform X2 n=1 Tax=Lupinus angustifolius TaxID=3871 RepID=UPI00092E353E|nr:PREDICTED: probable folate-biopterin transporter 6 isoform X2 [Lupinus angustifolius]